VTGCDDDFRQALVLYQKRPPRRKFGKPHQNLRRSLLIQRLEGSRPAVRSGAMAMGFR
jgi:hypothetical protein